MARSQAAEAECGKMEVKTIEQTQMGDAMYSIQAVRDVLESIRTRMRGVRVDEEWEVSVGSWRA